MTKLYKGGENIETINHLLNGETVIVGGKGNSMTPKLKSGEYVIQVLAEIRIKFLITMVTIMVGQLRSMVSM